MSLLYKIFAQHQQKPSTRGQFSLFMNSSLGSSNSVDSNPVLPVAQSKIWQSPLTLFSLYSTSSPSAYLVTFLFIKYPKSNHFSPPAWPLHCTLPASLPICNSQILPECEQQHPFWSPLILLLNVTAYSTNLNLELPFLKKILPLCDLPVDLHFIQEEIQILQSLQNPIPCGSCWCSDPIFYHNPFCHSLSLTQLSCSASCVKYVKHTLPAQRPSPCIPGRGCTSSSQPQLWSAASLRSVHICHLLMAFVPSVLLTISTLLYFFFVGLDTV